MYFDKNTLITWKTPKMDKMTKLKENAIKSTRNTYKIEKLLKVTKKYKNCLKLLTIAENCKNY